MQIFFFTLNDANWEDNNVPYERRVVADLGNGQKERGKVHDKVFPLHSRRLYSESRVRVSFSCSSLLRDD